MVRDESQTCTDCGREKPLVEFPRVKAGSEKRRSRCQPCAKIRQDAWRAANPDRVREKRLAWKARNPEAWREYNSSWRERNPESAKATNRRGLLSQHGLTTEAFAELSSLHDGACHCCGVVPEKTLRIDHDHACCPGRYSCGSCVRGLLRDDCNVGIARLGDDLDGALRAAAYFTR